MTYTRRPSNGTGYGAEQYATVVRAIRGQLPPRAGQQWLLDETRCDAELTTTQPVSGVRRHELRAAGGTLSGLGSNQLEIFLALACVDAAESDDGEPVGVVFRSTSIERTDSARYLVNGELSVGAARGSAAVRIHDLSWIAGVNAPRNRRILTLTANLERSLWDVGSGIRTRWLTRDDAEIFLHTEWLEADNNDDDHGPAAA